MKEYLESELKIMEEDLHSVSAMISVLIERQLDFSSHLVKYHELRGQLNFIKRLLNNYETLTSLFLLECTEKAEKTNQRLAAADNDVKLDIIMSLGQQFAAIDNKTQLER